MDLHLSGSLIPRIWLLTDLEKKEKNITKVGVLDDPSNFGSTLFVLKYLVTYRRNA